MKFLLFDAMSLVFRAYHAMSKMGLQAPNGELTGAVFGFANILATILTKEKPDYLCIAFDTAAPTFRHEKFDQYKAHRPEFPEDLVPQLLRIKQMITLLNITQLELPGYEADDIIGTLTKRFTHTDNGTPLDVYCITSDKDYFQLVNDRVQLLRPGFSMGEYEIVNTAKVHEKFGVAPHQVIDVLALIGDSSDNVPGVKGIGEKSGIPLIQEFGSVESVYENLHNVSKEAVRKKLEASRDMAFLSKELVTIHTTVPLECRLEEFSRREPQADELREFFLTLGFKSVIAKFLPTASTQAPTTTTASTPTSTPTNTTPLRTIKDTPHEYVIVQTEAECTAMLTELQTASLLAFDTETTSLDTMNTEIVGVSLSARAGHAFYVPIPATTTTAHPSIPQASITHAPPEQPQTSLFGVSAPAPNAQNTQNAPQQTLTVPPLLQALKPLLENPTIAKCGQNAKFDTLVLRRYGITVTPVEFDTMLASYVLNSDTQHNMDALAAQWLQYKPVPISALIGENKKEQRSMRDVPLEQIAEYAAEDADVTFQLYTKLHEKLEQERLLEFARRVEFPLVEVLTEMEHNGITIDTKALAGISALIRTQTTTLRESIRQAAGQDFNVDSPKQLGEILFEKMGIPPVKKTKTGYSTDSSVLEELSAEHPIAELVLEYRQLTKLQSTYVETLPKLVNPRTGRIHTTFNQNVTSTGRLSSTDPNLQNIPIRTELGMEIRRAFIADRRTEPAMLLLSADYSQIELRIMAHICGDETLVHAFQEGLDIHAATAAVLFGKPVHDIDRDMRRVAKTVNFGVMYGLGAFGLAQRLKISRTEGKEIIDNYFAKYPRIKEYIDSTIQSVREKGYASTLLGRRKYYPDITSSNRVARTAAERAAINMPIQGTAAEMMKLAMTAVYRAMKEARSRSKMLLQIHDELVFEMPPDEHDTLPNLVQSCMESAMSLGTVPVVVEVGTGTNWAEAH